MYRLIKTISTACSTEKPTATKARKNLLKMVFSEKKGLCSSMLKGILDAAYTLLVRTNNIYVRSIEISFRCLY